MEWLRGIAILAVLAIHTTSYPVAFLSKDSLLYPFYHFVNNAAHFAVPVFLFLSALLLFYHYDGTKQNWLRFYARRLKKIVIPYLIWSVFYALVVWYVQQDSLAETVRRFFHGLLLGEVYEHLYFIVVIAQFYVLFPLFQAVLSVKFVRKHAVLCGAAAQIAIYLLNYYVLHLSKTGTFVGSYLLYFFLGAYAAGKLQASADGVSLALPKAVLFTGFPLFGLIYVGQTWLQKTDPHWIPQPYLSYLNFAADYAYSGFACAALLLMASLFAAGRLGRLRGMLQSLGVYSFGIYLIHPFFLLVWRLKVVNNGVVSYHVLTWVGGILALLLSWLITRVLQNTRLGVYVVGETNRRAKPEALSISA